jgi:transketolase
MRPACVDMVFELAKRDPRVAYIGSDLSPDITLRMKKEMPGRAFMEGVSEQHVIGMAAGLAMEGYIPFVHTIATFITRRCFEQVAIDLCLHNLPVRLIGNGGGVVYAPLGPTHLAVEDMAIMRALPNMTVVAVCDADEMRRFMPQTLDWPGPIYIRLAKGSDPIVSRDAPGFRIGAAIPLREAAGPGAVLMVATGVMTTRALAAAETLARAGIDATVLHVHTVKPLDVAAIRRHARSASLVLTLEEHTLLGGLGSAVTDALVESGDALPRILRLGLPDAFVHHYGSQDDLLAIYGLQPPQIVETVRAALGGARMSAPPLAGEGQGRRAAPGG